MSKAFKHPEQLTSKDVETIQSLTYKMYKNGTPKFYILYKSETGIKEIFLTLPKGNWWHLLGLKDAREHPQSARLVDVAVALEQQNLINENNSDYKKKIVKPYILAFSKNNNRRRHELKKQVIQGVINLEKNIEKITIPVDNFDFCLHRNNFQLFLEQEQESVAYFAKSLRNSNIAPEGLETCYPLLVCKENHISKEFEAIKFGDAITRQDWKRINNIVCNKQNISLDRIREDVEEQITYNNEKLQANQANKAKSKINKYIKKIYNQGHEEKAKFFKEQSQNHGYKLKISELEKLYKTQNIINNDSIYKKPQHDCIESNRNVGDGVVGRNVEKKI